MKKFYLLPILLLQVSLTFAIKEGEGGAQKRALSPSSGDVGAFDARILSAVELVGENGLGVVGAQDGEKEVVKEGDGEEEVKGVVAEGDHLFKAILNCIEKSNYEELVATINGQDTSDLLRQCGKLAVLHSEKQNGVRILQYLVEHASDIEGVLFRNVEKDLFNNILCDKYASNKLRFLLIGEDSSRLQKAWFQILQINFSSKEESKEFVAYLFKHKVDTERTFYKCVGENPLISLVKVEKNNFDSLEIVRMFLEEDRNFINGSVGEGWTSLHIAANLANANMVRLLKSYGADVSKRTGGGDTPLMLVLKHSQKGNAQRLETVKALLALGSCNECINDEDGYGKTALRYAVDLYFRKGWDKELVEEMVKALLERGASVSCKYLDENVFEYVEGITGYREGDSGIAAILKGDLEKCGRWDYPEGTIFLSKQEKQECERKRLEEVRQQQEREELLARERRIQALMQVQQERAAARQQRQEGGQGVVPLEEQASEVDDELLGSEEEGEGELGVIAADNQEVVDEVRSAAIARGGQQGDDGGAGAAPEEPCDGNNSDTFITRQAMAMATIVALVAGGCAATYAVVTNYFPEQLKKIKAKMWGNKTVKKDTVRLNKEVKNRDTVVI